MPSPTDPSFRVIDTILHPTDFSPASRVAFEHALKAALVAGARLTLFHVASEDAGESLEFPAVRETLERWGVLPPDSPRSALHDLGIEVRKVVARPGEVAERILDYLESHPIDLIVLAPEHVSHTPTWLPQAVGEPVARRSGQMTLLVPNGLDGFVSAADGALSLQSIVIPVAESPAGQPAIDAAARVAARLNCPAGQFTVVHIGPPGTMPALRLPEVPGWTWNQRTFPGEFVAGIAKTAHEAKADLVVMSTDGRNGFLDVLRGTHSERVLRAIRTPLLTVPIGSTAEQRLEG